MLRWLKKIYKINKMQSKNLILFARAHTHTQVVARLGPRHVAAAWSTTHYSQQQQQQQDVHSTHIKKKVGAGWMGGWLGDVCIHWVQTREWGSSRLPNKELSVEFSMEISRIILSKWKKNPRLLLFPFPIYFAVDSAAGNDLNSMNGKGTASF